MKTGIAILVALMAVTGLAVNAQAVPTELSFKVMVSTYYANQLTQAASAQMVVSQDGVVFGTYNASSGGFLDFTLPTSGTVTWALTTGNLAVRNFSSSLTNGYLQIFDQDNNRELYYRESGQGTYYFEYYWNSLYITNQGSNSGIILGELKGGSTANALSALDTKPQSLIPMIGPTGTISVGGGRLVTQATSQDGGTVNNFGGLGQGGTGQEKVGGTTFTGLANVGGTSGENSSTSGQINTAITSGGDTQINRLASFSYGSSSEVPGLVVKWTYPDGSSDSWFMPLGSSGSLAVAILWQTTIGTSSSGVNSFSVMMRLGNAFLSGLASGTHGLTYWLVDSGGVKSNQRWEYLTIN